MPKDPNFPLPGNMGVDSVLCKGQEVISPHQSEGSSRRTLGEAFLEVESDVAKRSVIMETFLCDLTDQQENVSLDQVRYLFINYS